MDPQEHHREACRHYLYLLFHNGTLIELQAAATAVLHGAARRAGYGPLPPKQSKPEPQPYRAPAGTLEKFLNSK